MWNRWYRVFTPGLLALTLALSFAAGAEEPPTRFEMYPLGTADRSSTEAALRTLVGESGSVLFDEPHNRFLVMTTGERHEQIRTLLGKLVLPPLNVRIDVAFDSVGGDRKSTYEVTGRGAIVKDRQGSRTTFTVKPVVENVTTETRGMTRQTLLVSNGREGRLFVGESIPRADWFVDYALRWGYLQQRVTWQDVGAYLLVQPTVLADGETVRVRLTPELSSHERGQPQHTKFTRAATEVVVQNGEPFSLGGLQKDESFYSRFLVGQSRGSQRQHVNITLTPHIVDPTGSPP